MSAPERNRGLCAGISAGFLGDDGFGLEVVRRLDPYRDGRAHEFGWASDTTPSSPARHSRMEGPT